MKDQCFPEILGSNKPRSVPEQGSLKKMIKVLDVRALSLKPIPRILRLKQGQRLELINQDTHIVKKKKKHREWSGASSLMVQSPPN